MRGGRDIHAAVADITQACTRTARHPRGAELPTSGLEPIIQQGKDELRALHDRWTGKYAWDLPDWHAIVVLRRLAPVPNRNRVAAFEQCEML
jgi:hypothetical protein